MRRTASILLAGALALGAVAANDGEAPEDLADHPCYDETTEQLAYPEQQVWFHEGESKVGNTTETAAPWDTTRPETSVTGGAGAGTVTPGVATLGAGTPAEQHAVFSGTFEGCLDTLLLDLYSFDPTNRTGTGGVTDAPSGCLPDCTPGAEPANSNLGLVVTIDGYDVYTTTDLGDEALTELANEGFGPNRNLIAVDLREIVELYAASTPLELDGTHEITVQVRSWFVNTGHSVFVWDTSEVPSGLTFNGTIPEGVPTVG